MKRTELKRKTPLKRASIRRGSKGITAAKKAFKVVRLASRSVLIKKLEDEVRYWARQNPCVVTGYGGNCGGALSGSHILPKGAYPSLRFDPLNVVSMCYRHHIHWWHKNPLEGAKWLAEAYGKGYEKKLRTRHGYSFSREEMAALVKCLKESPEKYRKTYDSLLFSRSY